MKVLEHGIGLVIHDVWGSKQGSLVQSIIDKDKGSVHIVELPEDP